MSITPTTDHPRKNDFVTVTPEDHYDFCGVVLEEFYKNGALHEYKVQPWDHNGPLPMVVTVDEQNVRVHGGGRLTVLDDTYSGTYKHR